MGASFVVCGTCKTELAETARYCSVCGKQPNSLVAKSAASRNSPPGSAADSEQVFLDEAGVRVTAARLIVRGTTYAMAGITSVATVVETPSKVGPGVTLILGAAIILAGLSPVNAGFLSFGVVFALAGALWFQGMRPTFTVRVATASGEKTAYASKNRTFVNEIVQALNDSIVHRG